MTDTETVLEFDEAERIAGELMEKYGDDALDFVRSRAERARSVGDDLAYEAWRAVMAATRALLAQRPLAAE
jgi:hypothetical protein